VRVPPHLDGTRSSEAWQHRTLTCRCAGRKVPCGATEIGNQNVGDQSGLGLGATILLILTATSSTTWQTVRKSQWPAVADTFQTQKPVEVSILSSDGGTPKIEVCPEDRFRLGSARQGLLFEGRLNVLRIDEANGVVHLVPGPGRAETRGVLADGGDVPLTDLNSVRVEVISDVRTAWAIVGVVLAVAAVTAAIVAIASNSPQCHAERSVAAYHPDDAHGVADRLESSWPHHNVTASQRVGRPLCTATVRDSDR
jgi:hypothetical protein